MIEILIVEDEKAIANLIYKNLTAEGYHCTAAYDGKQGADYIENNNYDLVLLDIMLPEIDGYELLEYVRRLFLLPRAARCKIASKAFGLARMTISSSPSRSASSLPEWRRFCAARGKQTSF
mgnify:CR=1 FL=1